MFNFGLAMDANCVLCNGGVPETVQHIFTACPFTVQIFDNFGIKFVGDWNSYLQGRLIANHVTKMQEQLAYLYFSVAGHTIWKEQNLRIHEAGHKCTPHQITCSVKQTMKEKLFTSTLFRRQASNNTNLISLLF